MLRFSLLVLWALVYTHWFCFKWTRVSLPITCKYNESGGSEGGAFYFFNLQILCHWNINLKVFKRRVSCESKRWKDPRMPRGIRKRATLWGPGFPCRAIKIHKSLRLRSSGDTRSTWFSEAFPKGRRDLAYCMHKIHNIALFRIWCIYIWKCWLLSEKLTDSSRQHLVLWTISRLFIELVGNLFGRKIFARLNIEEIG